VSFGRKLRSPLCVLTFFPQPVGRRLAVCCGDRQPKVAALTTPASGAADSWALGGHVILAVPSERVVRFCAHRLHEGFRALSPLCSRSWGAAHACLVRDGGALVAPAPRRSPSCVAARRGVNRSPPAAPLSRGDVPPNERNAADAAARPQPGRDSPGQTAPALRHNRTHAGSLVTCAITLTAVTTGRPRAVWPGRGRACPRQPRFTQSQRRS
jgi:hypothetical protein